MAQGIALRKWSLAANDYDTEQEFREAVQSELALAEHMCERLGIGIVAAPVRERVSSSGEWVTLGWVFQNATIPAVRAVQAEAEDAAEPTDELEDLVAAIPGAEPEAE